MVLCETMAGCDMLRAECVYLLGYLRLLFNKPPEAHPPHAPREYTSKPMVRVLGEAPEGSVHEHRTRSGARCRVRLRLEVPNARVIEMWYKGWVAANRREHTRNCDQCVFREY